MENRWFLKLRAESGIGEVSHEKQAIFMGSRCFFCASRRAGGRGGARKTTEITPASAAQRSEWDRGAETFCGSSSLRIPQHEEGDRIVGQAHSAGVAHSGFSSTKKGSPGTLNSFCNAAIAGSFVVSSCTFTTRVSFRAD